MRFSMEVVDAFQVRADSPDGCRWNVAHSRGCREKKEESTGRSDTQVLFFLLLWTSERARLCFERATSSLFAFRLRTTLRSLSSAQSLYFGGADEGACSSKKISRPHVRQR